MTYDGKSWILAQKDDVIDQLYIDKKDFLEEKYKELYNSLLPSTKTKFGRFIDDKTEKTRKDKEKDIGLILYNKKDLPIKAKEIMESKISTDKKKLLN
jgi:hypothetical protein